MAVWRERPCPQCGVEAGAYCLYGNTGRRTLTPHASRKTPPSDYPQPPKRIVMGEGVLENPFPDLPKTIGMWNGPQRVLLPIPDEARGKRVRLVLEVIEEPTKPPVRLVGFTEDDI